MNGDLSQHKREKMVEEFGKKNIRVIVATDVAARGLHVDNVTHVFNYDVPDTPDTYTLRVGRAGRQEKKEKPLPFLKAMTIRNGGRSKGKRMVSRGWIGTSLI